MASGRIEEVIDGCLRPVSAAPALLSSTQAPWAGFLLERDLCREGSADSIVYPHTSLVIVTSGSIHVADTALPGERHFVARRGSVTLWPAGYESRCISWSPRGSGAGYAEMIRLQVDLSLLSRLAPEELRTGEPPLAQQPGIDDPALVSLVGVMEAEVAAGCPSGRLFGESVCLALATHLPGRYAAARARPMVPKGGLSNRQLERVVDLVRSQLERNLSLHELAAAANLSPRHFAVAFRKSVGISPHRYVLRQRIAAAMTLLANGDLTVAEIALSLGFASQSHFTAVFRGMVGMTPGRYRLAH